MNTPSENTPQGRKDGGPAAAIEQEIEGTRKALDGTLDALETKLSPRANIESAKNSLRGGAARLASRGLRAASPKATSMIRFDHAHVRALFHRFTRDSANARKQALIANACIALEIHAQLEEEIFYPRLREVAAESPALAECGLEHHEMRQLIENLRALAPEDPRRDEQFLALMREVLHHIADEETILLPLAEDVLSDELSSLGAEMSQRRLQLLRPHVREVTVTSIKSFPVAFAALAVGVAFLGWRALRGFRTNSRSG